MSAATRRWWGDGIRHRLQVRGQPLQPVGEHGTHLGRVPVPAGLLHHAVGDRALDGVQHPLPVGVRGRVRAPGMFDQPVRDLLQAGVVAHAAEHQQAGHAVGMQDLAHREVGRRLRRANRVEDDPGVAGEDLALLVAEGRGRDHRHDVLGQRQEVDRQRRENRLQRIPLLLGREDGERRLAISLERVAIVGAADGLRRGAELEAVVHVERHQDVFEVRERLPDAEHVGAELLEPDLAHVDFELQMVDQVGPVVPYARPGMRGPMKLLLVCIMKTSPSSMPCRTISFSAARSSTPSGNSR